MQWVWHDGKFLGIEWHAWKVIGWAGNALFTSRFLVQWWATEKHRRVAIDRDHKIFLDAVTRVSPTRLQRLCIFNRTNDLKMHATASRI